MRRKLIQADISNIIELYNLGKSQIKIANQFNCSQTLISKILRKNNIKTRVSVTTYQVNQDFFKAINSQESAYFLGLLYADGCVSVRKCGYTLSIKLQIKDQIIIEKFRDIMSPLSPIKVSDGKYCYFRINQKEICQQLIRHGCVPKKSLILKFPETVPDELLSHFIRGYSDGDGCIYNNKLKRGVNTIWKIVSTKDFCERVKDLLKDKLKINSSISLSRPNNLVTSVLVVGGNLQVRKLLDWIYYGATVYLPRKHERYLEFIKD